MSNTFKVNCALFSAVSLWAGAFVAIRVGLNGYSPASVGFIRFAIASLCLGIPLIMRSRWSKFSYKNIFKFMLVGVGGTALYTILLNSGERSISPSMASFLIAQTPIINAFFAILFLKERPSLNTIIAIAISGLGVTIIVFEQPFHASFNLGLLLVFIATFCGSMQSIIQKRLLLTFSPLQVTCFSTWWATLALGLCATDITNELSNAPISATYAVLFLGLLPSSLGQLLWNYGLSKTLVIKASAYLYIMPFLSTFFAWVIFSEVPSFLELLGGAIALLGVILINKEIKPSLTSALPASLSSNAK